MKVEVKLTFEMDKLTLEKEDRPLVRVSKAASKLHWRRIWTLMDRDTWVDLRTDSVLWVSWNKNSPPILVQTEDVNRIKSLEERLHLKQLIGTTRERLVYLKRVSQIGQGKIGKDFEKKMKLWDPDATKTEGCQSGHHNGMFYTNMLE